MATLERVMQLKAQGVQDAEIIQELQNQGIPPKEIQDSLSQANIKQAVSPEQPTQDMQQSIMPTQQEQALPNQGQSQQPAQPQEQMQVQQPEYSNQDYGQAYPQTPQAYPQQAYYPQSTGVDTETITEIAEQVMLEKLQEFNQKTGDIASFKNQTTEQIQNLDQRLTQIESSIEQLQQAIIQKIGDFGENSETIKKDLNNLHNTVSKLMNPLIDNYKELKKISKKK